MKVFLAATSLDAAYGGPAFSVAGLARALTQAGVETALWAVDGSAAEIAGVAQLQGSAEAALGAFGPVDVLHDNGIWLAHNHRLAVLARARRIPRVVSTRGMLAPWAMRHKRLKKAVAWHLYQRRDLARAELLHATAAEEAADLDRFALGVPVCTIPNGVDLPPRTARPLIDTSTRTALFLGRLYPVKGLPMLIEAWARIRPKGWRLRIAGPDEAGHRAALEAAVRAAALGDVISFFGEVRPHEKSVVYGAADLFILPSHSESFGMVVAEALAHELPVLTTRNVPWPELAVHGCGWSVDANADALARGLRMATAHEPPMLRAMGAKGRAWMAAEFGWDAIARRFIAAYEQAVLRA